MAGCPPRSLPRWSRTFSCAYLPFTLLSDEGSRVRKSYGVPAILGLVPGRVTYVIDRTGTVRHSFNSMTNISQHVSAALKMVQRLQAEPPA
ncbi:MAG TPA: redoxin domain-containing protein [Trebonia sp.]